MSQPAGERQFEASAARLRKARQEGDVARSADLCGAAAFMAALAALAVGLPLLWACARCALERSVNDRAIFASAGLLGAALLPICASASAALFAGIVQGGGLHLRAPTIAFARLNPTEGFRRMFSRETALTVVRGGCAVGCIILVLTPLVYGVLAEGVRSQGERVLSAVAWNGALRVGFAGAALAFLFGAFDYAVVLMRWKKRLRMTFEEFKRDQRESEGDPLLRSRRRTVQREISRQALARVADAAFIIVNPQHVAIALAYHPPEVAVPRVLIRAADHAAQRLRAAAAEHGIAIVEEAALARALYATTVCGESIPLELYIAVAAVVVALARGGRLK